jgi:membrane-bound serine protease (ClpP class)
MDSQYWMAEVVFRFGKLFGAIVFLAVLTGALGSQAAPVVKWTEIDGVINPASARFLQRALDEAAAQKAEALLIELDTPGGLMDSMRDIIKGFFASEVPVIVYVAPSGSRAGSAGVFITLAANVAAMAPGTNIGAAHPVTMGAGESKDSTMTGKIVNDAVAFIRSIADKRHRNADWAESAVRQSASITETEALKKGVIDLIVSSRDSLLKIIDGREVDLPSGARKLHTAGAVLEEVSMTWRDRLLLIISDPNIAYVLMLLGIYGLFFELYNPGAIVPGVVGGICLILAFFAFQTLPVNIAGLLLIILAIILFLLEIKVTSYGILSIGGTISLILGSIMLIESPIPGLRVSLSVILPGAIGTALFFALAVGLSVRAQRRRPTTGMQGMVGETGEVIEALTPRGKVKVRGEIWTAQTSNLHIPVGTLVRVNSVKQLTLNVEPYPDEIK